MEPPPATRPRVASAGEPAATPAAAGEPAAAPAVEPPPTSHLEALALAVLTDPGIGSNVYAASPLMSSTRCG